MCNMKLSVYMCAVTLMLTVISGNIHGEEGEDCHPDFPDCVQSVFRCSRSCLPQENTHITYEHELVLRYRECHKQCQETYDLLHMTPEDWVKYTEAEMGN